VTDLAGRAPKCSVGRSHSDASGLRINCVCGTASISCCFHMVASAVSMRCPKAERTAAMGTAAGRVKTVPVRVVRYSTGNAPRASMTSRRRSGCNQSPCPSATDRTPPLGFGNLPRRSSTSVKARPSLTATALPTTTATTTKTNRLAQGRRGPGGRRRTPDPGIARFGDYTQRYSSP